MTERFEELEVCRACNNGEHVFEVCFLLGTYETECLAEFPLLLWPLMISSFV